MASNYGSNISWQLSTQTWKGNGRKVQGFKVQFRNWLNQLSLTHESNKKDEERKTKQKTDEQLSPEMVMEINAY